ncbi:MAG: polymer-forming cytoskeletal protein [Filomicrobium sp.]
MFSRQSNAARQATHTAAPEPELMAPPPPLPAEQPVEDAIEVPVVPTVTESVIGQDLKILGGDLKLISEGNLTVDGIVEGDVLGANVVIGKHGQVNGLVHGQTVSIQGQVAGTVRAVDVVVKSGAFVEAEVHHNTLSLELGANFEGRSRRYEERADLLPDLNRAVHEGSEGHVPQPPVRPVPLTA